ncbi:spherulation-specific family 4 protein [Thermocrinis sp.]
MKGLIISLVFTLLYACGGSKDGVSEKEEPTSYLIPLYSYPVGQYQQEWEKLYNLRTNKRVFVIVNVSNGPGERPDPNFERAIDFLKSRGFIVLGYIFTEYGRRDASTVKLEADKWLNFYPNKIDGFFIDEVPNTMEKYSYYQQIHNHAKSLGKLVVLNPGTNTELRYFDIGDKIVVFESTFWEFLRFSYQNYRSVDPDRVCTIVYNVRSRDEAHTVKRKSLENGSRCIYILEDPSYFKLSTYID